MSISFEQLQFVLTIITLLGVGFSIYKHFKNPTIQAEKDILVIQKDIATINTCLTNHMCEYNKALDKNNETHEKIISDINEIKITLARMEDKL